MKVDKAVTKISEYFISPVMYDDDIPHGIDNVDYFKFLKLLEVETNFKSRLISTHNVASTLVSSITARGLSLTEVHEENLWPGHLC